MRAGPRRGWGAGAPGRHPRRRKGAASSLPCLGSLPTDGCPPAPSPRRPGVVPPQPRLTSPPLGVVGGRGAPEALPSLLPPPPPTPGRAATICGYSFTRQKKKVCRMSHTEKKKKIQNRAKKTCEWAWRMGLLKLRRSRGSPSHSASLREIPQRI